MLISPVHVKEIDAISDIYERIELQERIKSLGEKVTVDLKTVKKRAEDLFNSKFGVADAAHVAFAEQSGAEFISCDDSLIKKCSNNNIKVWCGDPVAFCAKEGIK